MVATRDVCDTLRKLRRLESVSLEISNPRPNLLLFLFFFHFPSRPFFLMEQGVAAHRKFSIENATPTTTLRIGFGSCVHFGRACTELEPGQALVGPYRLPSAATASGSRNPTAPDRNSPFIHALETYTITVL